MPIVFKLKASELFIILTVVNLVWSPAGALSVPQDRPITRQIASNNVEGGGAIGTGGGDQYVADFISIARNIVYPWLLADKFYLSPAVNPEVFLKTIERLATEKRIVSAPQVFETCDALGNGRPVEACYNSNSGMIYLSRTGDVSYSLNNNNLLVKARLVAHEIFRVMKIEGDDYRYSSQLNVSEFAIRGFTPTCDDSIESRQKWLQLTISENNRKWQHISDFCNVTVFSLSQSNVVSCALMRAESVIREYFAKKILKCDSIDDSL